MEKKERSSKEKKSLRSSRHLLPEQTELKSSAKVPKSASSTSIDLSQIYNCLHKVIPEVEKKKSPLLSNWSSMRPYMTFDFVPDSSLPPNLSAVPWQSQESILLEDLLGILVGVQGKYILAERLDTMHSPRSFKVADTIEPTLRNLIQQILPLASDYSIVMRFIEEKRKLKWGRVNQALASAMNTFIIDYGVFISQLESLLRRGQLSLQNVWFYLQSTNQTLKVLAKIASAINQAEAIGGRTLTILHEETLHYITDNNAQKLCKFLTKEAAVPYFDSLQRWLSKGVVFDPYKEFLIKDNKDAEEDTTKSETGSYTDVYWNTRYTICDKNVPVFLIDVQECILRTGRYLNVYQQCSESSRSLMDLEESLKRSIPPIKKLEYSLHGEQYLEMIETAYQFASSTLLDLLLTKYDIVNRIKSLKGYFLMEQGDFIVQLLDLCEEELVKPISEVVPSRLQTLFELALRTSTGKYDPYKEDMNLTILTKNNTYQILSIQSIRNKKKEEDELTFNSDESMLSRTGMEGFTFQVVSKWPLSLLFNQKIIGCYQMLFRHLVHCKHVDRRLCRVWISDKAVKQLPTTAGAGYLGAFSLRQRMLFCVQNLEYYMMEEAIEPNWIKFMSRLSNVRNIDDLLLEHSSFLDQCMTDCMFANYDLLKIINKLLESCIEFCDFIQRMQRYFLDAELLSPDDQLFDSETQSSEGVYSKTVENQSFENNVKRMDEKFTFYLISLLTTISSLNHSDKAAAKLRNILYRENFNGFYSTLMEKDYKMNDSAFSTVTSG